MNYSTNDAITINCTYVTQTQGHRSAILVAIEGEDDNKKWIPKSVCDFESTEEDYAPNGINKGDELTLEVAGWWAAQEGLI